MTKHSAVGRAFHETMGYMKPYEGALFRGGRLVNDDVRFYDEHEWRYLPEAKLLKSKGILGFLQHHQYMNANELAQANTQLENDDFRLMFQADDIKYIIISEENQINQVVGKIRDIKGSRYDARTVDRLLTRIITAKQITEDF